MDYDYIYDPMHRREGGQYDISSRTRRRRLPMPLLLVLLSAPRDKELEVRLLNYITLGGGGDFYVVLQNKGLLQENVD